MRQPKGSSSAFFFLFLMTGLAGEVRGQRDCAAARITVDRLAALPEVRAKLRPDQWLPDPSAGAVSLRTRRGKRVIASLSWEGLRGGMLVLLSCDERALAIAKVGGVDSMRAVAASAPDAAELLLYHQTGRGTGYNLREATVYAFDADTIAERWSGVVFEGNYPGPYAPWSEERARVTIPKPGLLVREGAVQGLREVERTNSTVPVGRPRRFREVYRWDGRTFRRQKRQPSH